MSLEFSPSDFVACIHFAQKVWKRCLDAPEEFRLLSTEVANLQLVLGEVQESVSGYELDYRRKSDLRQLITGCNEVLMELQSLYYKHKHLSSQSRRSWHRLSWGKDPVESIRQRVVAKIGLLTAFNISIVSASQARVQKLLQQLLFDHQAGLCEGSVISSDNLKLAEEGNREAWFHIGRELEDVGITPGMIRDHRQYIIRWVKNALKLGKLNEGTDLPSAHPHSISPMMYEQEKFISITEESISIRSTSSQAHDISDEFREPRESTITLSELSADSISELRDPPRPGDVSLSDQPSLQYRCEHVYCRGRLDMRYTTWFGILLHARTNHSTGSTPWSKHYLSDSEEANVNHPNLLCVNDSGKYLASRTPYGNIPADQDREEVAYVLSQLYRAVRNGSVPIETPQLVFDLYYSRRCAFSDCRCTSKNDNEHRQHFIGHFQSCEAQYDNDLPLETGADFTSPQTRHRLEAVARVQRRYAYPSEERPTRDRAFRSFGIFKRLKRYPPPPSTANPLTNSLPYRIIFSGQTIESIVGPPAADSTRAPLTTNNQRQHSLQPEFEPSNKKKRYSRPTAFALLPDLRIAQDDEKRTSSDYTPSTTRASSDFQVSSHMLSEKLAASQAEREGVLFIMASLRQTLGVSK